MPGEFIKPPTMGEDNGRIQLPLIYEATGLPAEYLTPDFIDAHIIPCVTSTFSDGEIITRHPPEEDPVVSEHFGTHTYNEGSFGERLRAMLEGDDIFLQHQVDSLIRQAAGIFAHDLVSGHTTLSDRPNVSVRDNGIEFDHHKVELLRPPETIIDYGPGLKGRFHIENQISNMMTGQLVYNYLAVGKGPFANEFLMQYWLARLGDNVQALQSEIIGRLYIGREDGIGAATTDFIDSQTQHTGSPELADVVVASGIHYASPEEVQTGIANAHQLLRPNGTLLIRAPKASNQGLSNIVSAEAMVDMAAQSGFDARKAQFFDTVTGGVAVSRVRSLSVVLRK